MEQAEIERVRRVLRQRSKPGWRVLWRGRPYQLQASNPSMGAWPRRRVQLQDGWQLLWTERLRRDLAPIYLFLGCRRGRHPESPSRRLSQTAHGWAEAHVRLTPTATVPVVLPFEASRRRRHSASLPRLPSAPVSDTSAWPSSVQGNVGYSPAWRVGGSHAAHASSLGRPRGRCPSD
jgi:hypothetical protein